MADNFEEMTFGWGTLVEIIIFIGSIMVIYFTQKARIDKLENQFDVYFDQNDKDKNEVNLAIDAIRSEIKKNQESVSEKIDGLKTIIHQNHIEILKSLNQKK
jgi:uncharacterized protein YwgA